MRQHNHGLMAAVAPALLFAPSSSTGLARSAGGTAYQTSSTGLVAMNIQAVTQNGNNQPHNNMMPYLTLSFCIAMQGVYPPRT
jgi:microcystin-dependent protein